MTLRFRTRIFLSAFAVAAISLAAVIFLLSRSYRQEVVASTIETLSAEARLMAREIAERGPVSPERLDADADPIGQDVTGRVTLIALDGRVLGDSSADGSLCWCAVWFVVSGSVFPAHFSRLLKDA